MEEHLKMGKKLAGKMGSGQFGVYLSIIYFKNKVKVFFNYSQSSDQYLSVLVSLLLIIGNYFLGKKVANNWLSDFRIATSFFELHYIIFGNILVNIILQYLILLGFANSIIVKLFGCILILFGIYSLIHERRNILTNTYKYYSYLVKSSNTIKIVVLLLIGFFAIALAPITNADALNYHVGVPMSILREGHFVWQPTWFHQGLSGIGENSILLSLVLKAEQYTTFLQIASIASILGLFFYREESKNIAPKGYRSLLILIFISVPVLLFLASSPKPQLVGIALSCFLFVNIVLKKIQISLRNLSILFLILFYIVAIKLNFIFSSFVLILALIFDNRKKLISFSIRYKLNILLIFFACFIIIMGPIIYYKSLVSGFNLPSYLYPIPDYYPG